MKERLKSYKFWAAVVSAALALLQALGAKFDLAYANEITTAALGALAVIGFIQPKDGGEQAVDNEEEAEK